MNIRQAVEVIKGKFTETDGIANIPKQGGFFRAELTDGGILVDNLGNQPFLPWEVFQEAVCVLIRNGGRAQRGDAMQYRLGENGLPFDSIEGHIAYVVYGKSRGDSVFRRITPIARILIWAEICVEGQSELILNETRS
jgi:hypothetical protein